MASELANPQTDRSALTVEGQTFEISKAAHFEAAHRLPGRRKGDPYGRVHGHSFRVEITVAGRVKPNERWVEDLAVVSNALAGVTAQLDHQMLNDVEGLDVPTLENIAVWIANRLRIDLPNLSSVTLARPSLEERCTLRITS